MDKEGFLRLEVLWSPPWDHMVRAQEVWNESGGGSPRPVNILAMLDPDRQVGFLGVHPKRTPPRQRYLSVSIDLLRPIEEQFREANKLCQLARKYTRMLSGHPQERPGRRELNRDVLIYTLRKSASRKIREIAEEVFPREDPEQAQNKVKQALRKVRAVLAAQGETKVKA